MTNRIVITGLVVVHLVATLWHGDAHTRLAIELPPEKNLFVYTVILLAPLVAGALVWTRYATIGLWVFALSMVGAVLFGAYHHYVLISPDNVGHLPAGHPEFHSQFITSAALHRFAGAGIGTLRRVLFGLTLCKITSGCLTAFVLERPLPSRVEHLIE